MTIRTPVLVAALVATAAAAASAGTLEQVPSFGSNPGGLAMWRYRPTTPAANAPLVIFMHGCSQTHSDSALVGWTQLADQFGFYVVFPEQSTSNNPIRCFNWAGEYGDPANLVRGQGENLSIKQMVDKMRADHTIDPSRIYVAGFSAGGAFASVMLATWPDVFAAGAVMAGIPYRCATTVNGAYNCQALNTHPELKKSPQEWGDLVRNAYPGYTGPRPRVAIFHGASDAIVSPDNQIELVEQWTDVLGADQVADETGTVAGHERVRHKVGGATVVESWRVASMGHAVSMGADPEHACPPTGGTYIENRGMCAAWRAAVFFGLTGAVTPPDGGTPDGGVPPDGGTGPDGGSSGGPAVSITAPGDGDEVSGAVTISAEASAPDGVARVEFKVDGVLKGSDGTAPYSYRWPTSNVSAGTHSIEAIVYDRWEVMASDEIEVMVGEGGGNPDDPTLVDPIPCGCSGGGAGAVGLGVVVLLLVGFVRRRSAR